MRTDNQKLVSKDEQSTTDSKEAMKVVRKSLHPLQVAAGDKENLVGAGRMPTISEKDGKLSTLNSKHTNPSPKKDKLKPNNLSPKKDKVKPNKNLEKKAITENDLTSEEGPSEHYWELLAETRRKALEKALKENQQLHERVNKLTEEKEKYKALMQEAQLVIDTLNEIIAEMDNEDDSRNGEEIVRRA